jgi:Zn finger protein HypA/HybF involved in hydrogenase expression
MPSDEGALQGYCVSCKRLFEVKHFENICQQCEHKPMQKTVDIPEEDGLSLQPLVVKD